MCGRYQFTMEESLELREILRTVQEREHWEGGEIFPSGTAPVLLWKQNRLEPHLLRWGFPGPSGKGVIINARAETASSKRMFRESLRSGRCIVPSSGFYEWDADKQKYLFRLPEAPELYMAALYRNFGGEPRYCILTTAANESMRGVHHRMPVVLPKDRMEDWMGEEQDAVRFLSTIPPPLRRETVSGQTRLW